MARRGLTIFFILLALLAGQALMFGLRAPGRGDVANRLYISEVLALVATISAGLVGLSGMAAMRRQSASLAALVRTAIQQPRAEAIKGGHPDLTQLVDAINESLAASREAVSKVSMRRRFSTAFRMPCW
jgi:hypothetical protein